MKLKNVLFKLDKSGLGKFTEMLHLQYEVFGPVSSEAGHVFEVLSKGQVPDLEYGNTVFSSKRFFLPRSQAVLEYSLSSGKVEDLLSTPSKKRFLFGIRQCELHAINLNDQFMLEGVVDPYYAALRKNTLIAVLQCKRKAADHCFCSSLGFDSVPEGFDLLFQDEGTFFVLQAGSVKGEELIVKAGLSKYAGEVSKPDIRCDLVLEESAALSMKHSYDHPLWDETAKKCISCGACTIVCPTCLCFDVEDQNSLGLESGVRVRRWDSCQYMEFGRVGGDFCFRRNRSSRVKHRVFHKYAYSYEFFGRPSCVGCGRCFPVCLTGINHVKVLNEIARTPLETK
ncbi:MAG: 4Fe-4S dicluster domain-containing protein [Candidatus Micrarchaeia archaeon]